MVVSDQGRPRPWTARCELKHWNFECWKCLIPLVHFASNSRIDEPLQAPCDTCLNSPFFTNLLAHGLQFTVCVPSISELLSELSWVPLYALRSSELFPKLHPLHRAVGLWASVHLQRLWEETTLQPEIFTKISSLNVLFSNRDEISRRIVPHLFVNIVFWLPHEQVVCSF